MYITLHRHFHLSANAGDDLSRHRSLSPSLDLVCVLFGSIFPLSAPFLTQLTLYSCDLTFSPVRAGLAYTRATSRHGTPLQPLIDPCRKISITKRESHVRTRGDGLPKASEHIEEEVIDGSIDTACIESVDAPASNCSCSTLDWSIDAILPGNGYQHNTKTLERGVWYDSAIITGRPEYHYKISERTFVITKDQTRATVFSNLAIDVMPRLLPRALLIPQGLVTRSAFTGSESAVFSETVL